MKSYGTGSDFVVEFSVLEDVEFEGVVDLLKSNGENANLRLEIPRLWRSRGMKIGWIGRAFRREERAI